MACTAAIPTAGSNASPARRQDGFIEVSTRAGMARSTTKLARPPSHSARMARKVVLAMSANNDDGRSAVTGVATTDESAVRVCLS